MRSLRCFSLAAILIVSLLPAAGSAQYVISAKAGLVQYTEGQVFLDEQPLTPKPTEFPQLQGDQFLRTEEGRAEVLLTPGIFLRLGPDSRMQMLSTSLSDVRFKLLSGTAIVEADEMAKSSGSVTAVLEGSEVHMLRKGLYRLDLVGLEPPRIRVFAGEATVATSTGQQRPIKAKEQVDLAGNFTPQKFNPEDTDPLDRWSKRRASYLSAANVSGAQAAYQQGGLSYYSSSWLYNPLFGMFTFLPFSSMAWSPYGFGFYNPFSAYYFYSPVVVGGVPAAQTGGSTGRGFSGSRARTSSTGGHIAGGGFGGQSAPAARGGFSGGSFGGRASAGHR